jgi:hypothetical protein
MGMTQARGDGMDTHPPCGSPRPDQALALPQGNTTLTHLDRRNNL